MPRCCYDIYRLVDVEQSTGGEEEQIAGYNIIAEKSETTVTIGVPFHQIASLFRSLN